MEKNKRQYIMNSNLSAFFQDVEKDREQEFDETELDFFIQLLKTADSTGLRPYKWLKKMIEAAHEIQDEQLSDLHVDGYYTCLYGIAFEIEGFYQSFIDTYEALGFKMEYSSTSFGRAVISVVDACKEYSAHFNSDELTYIEIQRHLASHVNPTGFEIEIKKTKNGKVLLEREYRVKNTGKQTDALEIDRIISEIETQHGSRWEAALYFESKTRDAFNKLYFAVEAIVDMK